jgi:hypothetical protein
MQYSVLCQVGARAPLTEEKAVRPPSGHRHRQRSCVSETPEGAAARQYRDRQEGHQAHEVGSLTGNLARSDGVRFVLKAIYWPEQGQNHPRGHTTPESPELDLPCNRCSVSLR